jgi:hypothetical protein
MIQVVVGIWTVVIVVFQTAGVRQRNPAFGDTTQNRSPHSYWLLSCQCQPSRNRLNQE